MAAQSEDSDVSSPNGNGAVKTPSKKKKSASPSPSPSSKREPKENVFLFAPNLIGGFCCLYLGGWKKTALTMI